MLFFLVPSPQPLAPMSYLPLLAVVPILAAVIFRAGVRYGVHRNRRRWTKAVKSLRELAVMAIVELGPELRTLVAEAIEKLKQTKT